MKQNTGQKDRSLLMSLILIAILVALFLAEYLKISAVIEMRSQQRMEEGVDTVIEEVMAKFDRDSKILNAAADILSSADNMDSATFQETMSSLSPLLVTMRMRILLPDNTVIQENGRIVDGTGYISFADEAPLGEHVSNRMISAIDGNTPILRHFVPIVQNGETVALLYGVTILEDLPEVMNVNNIYNAAASVFIIDIETGDYIMDTMHDELGTTADFSAIEFRGQKSWEQIQQEVSSLRTGHIQYKSESDGEWRYFYYGPAGINRWVIGVAIPRAVAFASVYDVRQICTITALILAAAVVLYYLWVRQSAKEATAKAVERAVLEEKLHKAEAAEKAKTTFLSNMSHDIRTPMNAITGFATLARNNIDNKERVQEYLGKILTSGSYLLSLINDVLDMSRIESGKLNIEEKPCSISDIFRDMRNIIQTQMQSKQLNFYMDTVDVVDEDIYCDKLHVNQVLLNLLSNAIKFTPAGGSVYLTISQRPEAPTGYGSYEIRVKDTGIGMSQEFVKNIFEPFERERNTTISGIQGTGLGMAITKSIVDTMGGTIEVVTEEGKGTEFIIHLDFRLQSERRQVETSEVLTGLRALVVDDNFSTCDSMTKMLAQLGMDAAWSMYGREAVLRARQAVEMDSAFFAYIVDWALPDLSGLEVVRQVRSIVGEDAVIIVMTAYDRAAFEDEATQAGVTVICNKPLFLSDLREILEDAVHKREASAKTSYLPELSQSLRGKRLLLVEDNELNREIAEELLIESGFVVESAEDGSIAVDKVQAAAEGWYDLILMDVQMPIMNGHDATRAIRALKDPAKASIPIVAMTANAFEEDRQHALACGMNDYVAKPIDVDVLMSVIQKILDPRAQ